MMDIVSGLDSLHSADLIHNDISANNVLMKEDYSLHLCLYFFFFFSIL
jgi:serine/threonine protein kinase